ncbi:H2.0-like homeobox protein isoform X2 [Strongylocentrotus purpuratus]|uniref:Homeobox domain-containing protein n=1 Tax=Strongylocentrotus purpuratus TaxID=7668 RepID=A0A7M7HGS9_STRPU|nr:H2.0-like homeobox protein isoform X2 [Strongylocentrotus purpuratus]
MLLEDFISTAPIIDQIPQHFLPNSYGLAPQPPAVNNTMDLGPPPVTRLVPDNLAAAARLPTNSVSRIEAVKSLLCSESDSEFSALSGDNPKLAGNSGLGPPSIPAARIPAQASFSAIPHPIPRLSSGAANLSTSLGDYRSSNHPFHIPLMIKIPTKVRLPPQKDGKRINQHTYKTHAPGDGLLKIDKKLDTAASAVPGAPLVSTDRLYQSIVMTDHGILNIISSSEPGSKVPTPPPSYLSVYSNSTGTSSSSVAPSLASTSSSDDQTQAAMAMTSLSLTQSTSVNGVKPKRSRSRGGLGKKRTSFTRNQVYGMERRFDQQRYLTSVERKEFSNSIGLDDHHVKIWFQNRRSKLKKQAVVSSSGGPVRPTTNIRAKPPPGTNPLPPQHFISHAIKSEDTSSSATSSVSCHQAIPAPLHPTHPTSATDYHQNMNGSIPPCMGAPLMAPQASSGVSYQSMNSTTASVPNSYSSSSTIPTGMNAFVASTQGVPAAIAPGSFAHPYAPQYHDSNANANVMMSSATHSHIPAMTTQASAMHGMSTMSGVPFQPPYGYVYDYGVDQGTAFAAQGSRSSSPFGNFPFSPGFHCLPDDTGHNSFHQMPIVPPVNMM